MSNLSKEPGVTREERIEKSCTKVFTVWLTGLSGSGKSTIARYAERYFFDLGWPVFWLDGDNLRHGLNKDLGFSEKERTENIRRVAETCKLMNDAGLVVFASFISPLHSDRKMAREIIGESFIETYVETPLETCKRRDPKGLYEKAEAGEIKNFTGVSAPYEQPLFCENHVSTDCSVEESFLEILTDLKDRGYLSSNHPLG